MTTPRTLTTNLAALAAVTLTTLAPLGVLAQDRPPPGRGHGPPPEALAACRGRARGATCTVTPPGGRAISGTCDSPAEDAPLACRPEGPPPGAQGQRGRRGPPPEALAACRDHARGASCTVTPPDGRAVSGTCDSPSREMPLACRPAGAPHGPPHGPPPAAYAACEDTSEGDACVVDTPHGTLEGVCRSTPEGRIACAPNHPPDRRDGDAP